MVAMASCCQRLRSNRMLRRYLQHSWHRRITRFLRMKLFRCRLAFSRSRLLIRAAPPPPAPPRRRQVWKHQPPHCHLHTHTRAAHTYITCFRLVGTSSLALDNNDATRWESAALDGEWLSVDLGAVRSIARVDILWEYALAWKYTLDFEPTGSLMGPWNGTGSVSVTNGEGSRELITSTTRLLN